MDTAARALTALAVFLLSPGCIWVSDQDLEDRREELIDRDGDGYQNAFGDGLDCDDESASVYPGAEEVWYDGVDQDCAGDDDYDADGDGFPAESGGGTDCDDRQASVYPGAPDPWYDGVDQDCDGNDGDQDGDGYDAEVVGGTDCDDTDQSISPGATEIWYDGVDQDCAGDDDYDADGDGDPGEDYGGSDCDDGDPLSYAGAEEVWYDGVDQDCAGDGDYDADGDGYDSALYGGEDCFDDDSGRVRDYPQLGEVVDGDCGPGSGELDFAVLDLRNSTEVSGPRLSTNGSMLSVAWGYETADDALPGVNYDGLGAILVDLSEPEGGELDYRLLSYSGDSGDFGLPVDAVLSEDYFIWGSSLIDGGGPAPRRRLYMDILAIGEVGDYYSQVAVDPELELPFQDVQLTMLPGEELRLIGCDGEGGAVYVMEGALEDIIGDVSGGAYTTRLSGASGDRCEYWPGRDEYVLSSAAAGTLGFYRRSAAALSERDLLSALDIRDIEAAGETLVAAEATEGLMIWDAVGSASEPTAEVVEQLDAVELGGQVMICAVDAGGAVTLLYGDSTGLEPLAVEGGLGSYEDCGLAAGPGDLVFLALRSGDAIELSYAYAP